MVRNAVHDALLNTLTNKWNVVPVHSGSFLTMGKAFLRVPPRPLLVLRDRTGGLIHMSSGDPPPPC